MKNLILLNENTQIKLNDTGTVIQFKAQNEGQPVSVTSSQTATFRIKNEFGFVKSVPASTNYGGYMFELDTSKLDGLVVGKYELELKIELDADDSLIFPDSTFVGFEITANALNITGEQLPMMSLDEFKDELKTYVDNQTASAETTIKNDFQSYVDGLSDSTIATANKASEDAQTAISTANGAVDTANTAKSTAESAVQTANTAKSTADAVSSKADNAQSTANDALNKSNANASLITSINDSINQPFGSTNLLLNTISMTGDAWFTPAAETEMEYNGVRVQPTGTDWWNVRYSYSKLVDMGIALDTDNRYCFSCFVKKDEGAPEHIGFYSEAVKDVNFVVDESKINSEFYTQIYVSFKFKSQSELDPSKSDYDKSIRFEQYNSDNIHRYYFTMFKLERGSKPSYWSISPYDIISLLKSNLNEGSGS